MKKINKINVCCQKVLPLVYDESLSYYEVLCKVIQKLNELIKINNNIRDEVHSDYLAVLEGARVATEAVASVTTIRDEVLTLKQATEQYAHDVTTVYNQTVEARDTAIAKADIAEQSATTATEKANIAQASATTATEKANSAQQSANTATAKADIAVQSASTATENANIAVQSASTATEKANIATEKADSAIQSANTATAKADIATEKANIASTSATTATQKAESAVQSANTATEKANIASTSATTATQKATEAQTNADKVLTAMSLVSGTINYYKGDNIEMTIYGGENDSMSVTITPTIRNNVLYIYGNVTQELTGQVTIHLPNIVTKAVNMTQVFDWAKTVLPNIDVQNLPNVTFGGGNGNTYTNGTTQEKLISTVAGKSIGAPWYSLNMQLFSNTLSEITVPYQSGTTLKYSFTIIQPLVFTNEVTPDPTDYITKLNEETQAREQADTNINKRIDNIVAQSDSNNTEIIDARLGTDGVTYSTLGTAIRAQVNNLTNDINVVNTIAINGEIVYFYQEHPKSNYYTEKVNLKANQTYTIYVRSTRHCAVTIRDASDNRTEIVNVWEEATKEFTPKTDITSLILWIDDEETPTSQTFIVKIYRGKIKDEIKKLEKTKDITVEKDGTGDFTKLVDAVNYVNSNRSIKFTVHVGNGTYDLVEELGNDYFENFKGEGLILDNEAHYIFSSDSKVICNYTGSNSNIKKYFSPFNANSGKHSGFTLENLTLECSNVRYGIHDEGNGQSKPYSNKYLNCTIIIDNSNNSDGFKQCIGGGLGSSCEIIIKDCFFQSIDADKTQIVTYHNGGDGRSNIVIESCYFAGETTCRCSYYGGSTKISRMMVSNCSMGANPIKIQESPDYTIDNFELIEWNNIIRSN